jgi:hypothetical protein
VNSLSIREITGRNGIHQAGSGVDGEFRGKILLNKLINAGVKNNLKK